MRRFIREFAYDLKEPGIHMVMIPMAALAFIVTMIIVQKALDAAGATNAVALPLLEILIPSLGGYGAIMLMQGLLDTEGGELAFTYPRTYLYWGLIRQFRFFILYASLITAVCIAVSSIMRIKFAPVFFLTLSQSFAVMAVSFLGVALSKKVSVGLIVLVAFVAIQFTIGWEFEAFNRIYVLSGSTPSNEELNSILYNSLIIGVFGWGLGQVWVRP